MRESTFFLSKGGGGGGGGGDYSSLHYPTPLPPLHPKGPLLTSFFSLSPSSPPPPGCSCEIGRFFVLLALTPSSPTIGEQRRRKTVAGIDAQHDNMYVLTNMPRLHCDKSNSKFSFFSFNSNYFTGFFLLRIKFCITGVVVIAPHLRKVVERGDQHQSCLFFF